MDVSRAYPSKLPEDLVRELKAGSPTLVDLDDKFGRVATEVDILSCLESKQTKTAIEKPDGSWKREGPPVLMVPSHSAQLGFTKEITVSSSSDHSGIAKLKRTEGGIYFDVSCAIQAATLQRQKGHSEAVVTLREVSKDSEQPVEEEIQAVEDTSDSCGHSEGYRTAEAKDVTAKPPKTQGVEDEQIRPSTGPLRGEQPRASSAAPPESDRAVQDEINAQQLLKGGLSAKAKCLDETALYRALRGAAESGHDAVVRQLLEEGTGVNARDGLGRTLLHWAAESGRDAVTQLLLEKGSNVNARDDSRRTALHWAAKNGHEAVAQQLLEKGAGVDTRDESRRTALHLAAGNGHEAVVRLLMEKGANADARDIYGLPVQRLMALGKAARSGLTELVLLLLKIWTNLDTGNDDDPSEWGRTPLHWAAENGHEAVTWLLLERGSNVNARDNSRRTALHWAATNGHEAVVRQLLKKGADASATDRWRRPALHQAAMNGHEAVARALLEKGASIGGRGDDGLSAQRSVAPQEAFTNRLKVTPLKKTAGVNTRDRYRRTALHWAAMNERNAVVQLLLDSGAEVDAREDDGRTALHWAAKSGNEAVVQQLLRKEANVNARDNRRRTALHWAAGSGREAVTRLLLENGLNVNARDGLGQTALHRAAKKGREAVVLLLLENGAKTNAKDGQRRSARDWADREGHKAVVSLLTHST
ncbi:MAG: hypothetical protein M1839_004622 [Geoglossum umbratile]|nr:MAG: hypothetical protein M1839_004622 [Geoglossum umbratile]